MPASESLLVARSLWKSFSLGKSDISVVENISLTVGKGEFICIVGPSGCGKTTLLQLLAGLQKPTKGEVLFDRTALAGPCRDIGIVFQKPNLMPWRTVLENVKLPLQLSALPSGEAQARAVRTLERVGLAESADNYPKTLSGGMEQRVVLARALVTNPRILLLDEPFAALDALTRERLNLELLRLWREQNLTAIMVTHDIREAVFFSDRVLVLSPRPATVAEEFAITLPRPRFPDMEYSESFAGLSCRIRRAIGE